MGFTHASISDLLGEQQRVSQADKYGGSKVRTFKLFETFVAHSI
jgi:hypothetical protein